MITLSIPRYRRRRAIKYLQGLCAGRECDRYTRLSCNGVTARTNAVGIHNSDYKRRPFAYRCNLFSPPREIYPTTVKMNTPTFSNGENATPHAVGSFIPVNCIDQKQHQSFHLELIRGSANQPRDNNVPSLDSEIACSGLRCGS